MADNDARPWVGRGAMPEWTRESVIDWWAQAANLADNVERLLYDLRLREPLNGDIEHLASAIRDVFHHPTDLIMQRFCCRGGLQGLAAFDKSMIDQTLLMQGVLDRVTNSDLAPCDGFSPDLLQRVSQKIAPTGTSNREATIGTIAQQILDGCVVLGFAGARVALGVNLAKLDKRSISEPASAPSVFGPRDGFIEIADTNISLVRRRLRTPALWVEHFCLGTISRTAVYLLHLHGVADDRLVREAKRRLQRIEIDGVLESNYLMELIRDAPGSPFPMLQRTERPDRVAAGLLEGQAAVIMDGTPFSLLAPATLSRFMKADEDYYQNWLVSTLLRGIRLIAIFLGVFLPGVYVAVSTFHQEFIPTPLMVTLAASRENVPLPSLFELLMLLTLFEIIREATSRVPQGIANALTIGGTLVVGEAAVRAGIVSSPAIIISAAVVIAFFAIPNYDLVQVARFLLYPILLAAGILGIYGVLFAGLALFLYLASLRSFGVPYLAPFAPILPRNWKDFVVRAPRWAMNTRPVGVGYANPIRQAPNQKPHLPGKYRP